MPCREGGRPHAHREVQVDRGVDPQRVDPEVGEKCHHRNGEAPTPTQRSQRKRSERVGRHDDVGLGRVDGAAESASAQHGDQPGDARSRQPMRHPQHRERDRVGPRTRAQLREVGAPEERPDAAGELVEEVNPLDGVTPRHEPSGKFACRPVVACTHRRGNNQEPQQRGGGSGFVSGARRRPLPLRAPQSCSWCSARHSLRLARGSPRRAERTLKRRCGHDHPVEWAELPVEEVWSRLGADHESAPGCENGVRRAGCRRGHASVVTRAPPTRGCVRGDHFVGMVTTGVVLVDVVVDLPRPEQPISLKSSSRGATAAPYPVRRMSIGERRAARTAARDAAAAAVTRIAASAVR